MPKKTSELTKAAQGTSKVILDALKQIKKKSDKELPFGYSDQKKP